jgi:hypothetical protein
MVKYLVTILVGLTLFLTGFSVAQPPSMKGTWVTPEQDLIEILNLGRNSSNCLSNKLLHEEYFHLFMTGDTLSFRQIYTSSGTQYKIEYVDRYDLKIVTLNDSNLVVSPVSDLSKAYFQNRSFLRLKRKEDLVDTTIVFEKMIYHATSAWGSPTISLELDNQKHLYLETQNHSGGYDKNLSTGSYAAVLDDSTYKEFIKQLRECTLKTLRFGYIKGADSPEITLITYFNGRRKYLKSMFPPRIASDLLAFIIWRLQSYPGLQPTQEVRKLER